MKQLSGIIITLLFIFTANLVNAQTTNEYITLIQEAQNLFKQKDFTHAAIKYSQAFVANGNKGLLNDRYNAACAWSQAGNNDSAFFQLERITEKLKFDSYTELVTDPDLKNLYNDPRWQNLCTKVKANKDEAEASLNKPLVAILDSVYIEDQMYRQQINSTEEKYGRESKEMKTLWVTINEKDSINLVKVTAILDKYGWLGSDVVGARGNTTLFLVIQHSDLKVQEHYLPMLREAVKQKKAAPSHLALLEDRVALKQGKMQVYGSQIGINTATGEYYVSPLEDPDHVDERRADVGLPPLADYVTTWKIKWDIASYKKQLPEILKLEKKTRNNSK